MTGRLQIHKNSVKYKSLHYIRPWRSWISQWIPIPKAGGSNPSGRTKKKKSHFCATSSFLREYGSRHTASMIRARIFVLQRPSFFHQRNAFVHHKRCGTMWASSPTKRGAGKASSLRSAPFSPEDGPLLSAAPTFSPRAGELPQGEGFAPAVDLCVICGHRPARREN